MKETLRLSPEGQEGRRFSGGLFMSGHGARGTAGQPAGRQGFRCSNLRPTALRLPKPFQ
jgi:hypothetical protein